MGTHTISAKSLAGSVDKARGLGTYEERFSITEDCEAVVRNLRPDEYEQVIAECKSLDGIEYLNAFQKAHVCRAICEINGQSLRDVRFIEVEEPDPKNPDKIKPVKLELHAYLRKYVVDTWAKEILYVVYRKFGDAVAEAEKRSKDGIHFAVPEETSDERIRRLLGELKEASSELPPELVERVLGEYGYLMHTTAEQAKSIDTHLAGAATTEAPTPVEEAPVAAPPAPQAAPSIDPVRLMRQRVPMNQAPAPQASAQAVSQAPSPSQWAAQAPVQQPVAQVQQAPVVLSNNQPNQGRPSLSRAARFAALEQEADQAGIMADLQNPQSIPVTPPAEIPMLTGRSHGTPDPSQVLPTIDLPPPVGLNPLYRPPPR